MIVGSVTRESTVPRAREIETPPSASRPIGLVWPFVRAVIADDELLLREGVARLLEEAGIEVVARAADASDLLRKVRGHKPDVAIIDVRMPPDLTDDGLRAALEIRREQPEVGVLMFSQHLVERYVNELVGDDARGVGYVLKHRIADLGYFIDAVRTVGDGGTALDPEVVARMLGRRRRTDPLEALTPREREVLALMAEGLSNNGIAERLTVGPPAVEKHVTQIFSKLDIGRDRAENQRVLAVLALLKAG
jgi:DNA-binding NarL/FixJ family response regulator